MFDFAYKAGVSIGERMKDNKDKLLTNENIEKAEIALLEGSGLQPDEFEIRKVIVDKELNHYMTTIIVKTESGSNSNFKKSISPTNKQSDKSTLVLVHGYGATGTLFAEILPILSINYNVIVFDLIGSGSSSRPEWDKISGAEAD